MKVSIISSVIAAIVGGIVTAIFSAVQIVNPIKIDLANLQEKNDRLEEQVESYKYGKQNHSAKLGALKLSHHTSHIDKDGKLTVQLLVDNQSNKDLEYFGIYLPNTTVQNDKLEYATANRVKIFNSGLSSGQWVKRTIPAEVKDMPVLIEFDDFFKESKHLSMITVSLKEGFFGSKRRSITLTDVTLK